MRIPALPGTRRSGVIPFLLLAWPLSAAADLVCGTGPFAPDCSLAALESGGNAVVVGDVRLQFAELPGLTVDHNKIRVRIIDEASSYVRLVLEPTDNVWTAAAGEQIDDQVAFSATKLGASNQIIGLSALGYEFDVDAAGSGTGRVSISMDGIQSIVYQEFEISDPAVDPAGGSNFPLEASGAPIFLGVSSSGIPSGSAGVNSISVYFDLPLVSALLPTSRSIQVGGAPATVFLTGINAGVDDATGCGLAPVTSVPAVFEFRTTDPLTNEVTGPPNGPVDIAAGQAQSYVVAFTPSESFAPVDLGVSFDCDNQAPAASVQGLNTLLLSASDVPVADIVALAATLDNDGTVKLPDAGVFSVATANVGADGSITATADIGAANLDVSILICETDPSSGVCLADPVDGALGVMTEILAGETPTFGIFVSSGAPVPFDPAANRVFVRFSEADGTTRGSTSVALGTFP